MQSWDFNTLVHFKSSATGIRISFRAEIHIPIQFKDKEKPYSSSAIPEVKIPGFKSGLHRVNLTACLGLSPCFCILLHIPNNINLNTRKHVSPSEHSQPLKLEQFTEHSKRKSKYEDKKTIFTQVLPLSSVSKEKEWFTYSNHSDVVNFKDLLNGETFAGCLELIKRTRWSKGQLLNGYIHNKETTSNIVQMW